MAVPMTADQFKTILINEGCRVVEHRSWSTHNRNHVGAWGPTYGVMMHHTAGNYAGIVDYVYDGDTSLPGPQAHGVITKDGTVHLVGWGRANHAGGGDPAVLTAVINESYGATPPTPSANTTDGNVHFIGFECVNWGDGVDPWPTVQLTAMRKVSAAVCRFYGWSSKSVIAHKEWTSSKIDPAGFSMTTFRSDVQSLLTVPAPGPIPAVDQEEGSPVVKYAIYEDGSIEKVSTRAGSDVAILAKAGQFVTEAQYNAKLAEMNTEIANARAARKALEDTNLKADYDALKALGVAEASARRMSQYTGPA